MLEHDGRARLVQTPTTTGLQPAFGAAATDTDSWATTDNNLLYNTIGTQPMKADDPALCSFRRSSLALLHAPCCFSLFSLGSSSSSAAS
ncbi:uncharacterized protein IUM83_17659 [Phytophthora cinnamomi]|uniref:uncharacterized protein n=1 Tax=Phytophthora cinnamomi TaxID=4785 RepID=UPI003559D8C5|nr:hypothetical protein IUM83_17659 [Phytophthora cinnamomi]